MNHEKIVVLISEIVIDAERDHLPAIGTEHTDALAVRGAYHAKLPGIRRRLPETAGRHVVAIRIVTAARACVAVRRDEITLPASRGMKRIQIDESASGGRFDDGAPGHAVPEWPGFGETRMHDPTAPEIDIAPFPARFHRGPVFGERLRILEGFRERGLPMSIDKTEPAVGMEIGDEGSRGVHRMSGLGGAISGVTGGDHRDGQE